MNGIDESRGMKPLLSVVIPVHNIKLYLERCVASLAAQTIADRMEVIMVENGSSDGSLAECRRLAGIYPFIKVVVNDVLGPSAARNLGVEHACGEMVGSSTGTIMWMPKCSERLSPLRRMPGPIQRIAIICWNMRTGA